MLINFSLEKPAGRAKIQGNAGSIFGGFAVLTGLKAAEPLDARVSPATTAYM